MAGATSNGSLLSRSLSERCLQFVGGYRGRLAPSPTGFLHLGHARTFWIAQERCRAKGGTLLLRCEDLDHSRCRPEFCDAMLEDLKWFGFCWAEGPDCGGAAGPYFQSERKAIYRECFETLKERDLVFPCTCSRKEIAGALSAPHEGGEEPVYPGTCRHRSHSEVGALQGRRVSWRFRVSAGEHVAFQDGLQGTKSFEAGRDFGDFLVWRHDDIPSYQLAVAVDDALMGVTEVVRGADLLLSTARQMLIFRAMNWRSPDYAHANLMLDSSGRRLAKRHDSLSLRALREQGFTPEELRATWGSATSV